MDHNPTGTHFDSPPGAEFIVLRPTKAPVSWDTYPGEEAAGHAHVGIKLSEPWVVVDIDTQDEADRLLRLVQTECIKTRVMRTTKGMHFWFTAPEPIKNSVRTMTALGLHADYRSWGKQSQVCVRLNGTWREWLTETPWDEIEPLPRWLRPLRQDKYDFLTMGEGDGRNTALFEYQILLSRRAFSIEEAKLTIRLINDYVLRDPLPRDELEVVSRPEAYPEPAREADDGTTYDPNTPWLVTNKNGTVSFRHQPMAEHIAKTRHVIAWQGRVYIYKDGYYQQDDNEIQREMIRLWPDIRITQRREVLEYLRVSHEVELEDEDYVINIKNGRLNLLTGELGEHSPDFVDFQQLNAEYDKRRFCPVLDNMLWRVFCGDHELMRLFEEIVGYCLVKNSDLHKLFIFTGDGSNGKSTVLKIIKTFLGQENVSTVSLQGFEDKFKVAELENKLANLGDDIPFLQIKDASIMKVLTSGDPLTVERKNERPFTLRNHAKLIFSTNKMPNINDHTDGLGRRMCIIPFDATFSSSDPDYDPKIGDKVTTPEAMTYVLNMAIRGLRRLQRTGRFTKSKKVEAALHSFQRDNDSVLAWLDEEEATAEALVGRAVADVYQDYVTWCKANGNLPRKQTGVTQMVKKQFDLTLKSVKRNGITERTYEKNL